MSAARRLLVAASVTVGTFLATLDATVIGTTMPSLISSLGGLPLYAWTFSVYLLASTIAIPALGKLADLYGRKPVYVYGMAVFLIGSILSSLSNTVEQLILFRAVQGIGAGAIVPTANTIIADTYSGEARARAQGLLGAVWGMAVILGPGVGVLITEEWGWPWIFAANLPFGLISLGLLAFALRENERRNANRSVDYWGGITFAIGVTILLSTLLSSGIADEGLSLEAAGWLAISAILLGLFILIECSVKEPMLPLYLFVRNKAIRWSSITGVLIGMSMLGAVSFVPLFTQGVIGGEEAAAGATLIPLGAGWAMGSIMGGWLVLRLGYRRSVAVGATIVFLGALMFTLMDTSSPTSFVGTAMATFGLGVGFSTTAVLLAVQNSVSQNQRGIATSSVQFLRTIGGIVGVSTLGMLLNSQIAGGLALTLVNAPFNRTFSLRSLDILLQPPSSSNIDVTSYLTARDALASGMHSVFLGILAIAILAMVTSFFIPAKEPMPELIEQPQPEES